MRVRVSRMSGAGYLKRCASFGMDEEMAVDNLLDELRDEVRRGNKAETQVTRLKKRLAKKARTSGQ